MCNAYFIQCRARAQRSYAPGGWHGRRYARDDIRQRYLLLSEFSKSRVISKNKHEPGTPKKVRYAMHREELMKEKACVSVCLEL